MTELAKSINLGDQFWVRTNTGITTRYSDLNQFGKFITTIIPNALIIAGLIGFFLLLIAGVTYIVEAGRGNQDGITKVSKWITSTIIGLIIVFVSYWLVKIIGIIAGFDII